MAFRRELKCTKKSINPVYPASCACQNPPEIQVEKVDTPQPSRRPEKPDHHLVDNLARSQSEVTAKGYKPSIFTSAPKQLHK